MYISGYWVRSNAFSSSSNWYAVKVVRDLLCFLLSWIPGSASISESPSPSPTAVRSSCFTIKIKYLKGYDWISTLWHGLCDLVHYFFRTDIIHTDFIWSGDKHVDLHKYTHTMMGLKRAFRTNSFYKSMHVSCSCMWYAIFQRNLKLAWSCYFLIFIFEHILITLLSAADISGL